MTPDIIGILIVGTLYLLVVVCDYLSDIKKSEEQTKKCEIPEYAFKCPNCHCDELNRGR